MAILENDKIQKFEEQSIRTAWDKEKEEWYFSVVDVVGVLTDSVDYNTARKYWNKLKQRLEAEGGQLVTNCHQLKMKSPKDGKHYKTDVATTELVKVQKPRGLEENKSVAQQGGQIAGNARESIEAQTGRPVITSENANSLLLNATVVGMIEGVVTQEASDPESKIRRTNGSEEM